MKYGSVCSGVEAATMAWHPLGWVPLFFSEIEPFPSAVLTHHYGSNMPGEPISSNGVPNLGDMTNFEEWPDYAIDLLVGGTPCQDYSIAGLRAGMDGIRGSLTLTYAAIARRYRPRWLAWENVPGVLSLNGGRDFASFLGLLSGQRIEVPRNGWRNAGVVPGYHRAYGLAWRVLDAQYVRVDGFGRAVPQRRRRVFVVGYLGDWRRAAAVLLEREGLLGDSAPRREAGENSTAHTGFGVTGSLTRGYGAKLGTDESVSGNVIAAHIDEAARCDTAGYSQRLDYETENFVAHSIAPPITHNPYGDHESREGLLVAHSLRSEGFDASEDGTGRGTPIVPVTAKTLTRGAESAGKGGYAGRRQEDDSNLVVYPMTLAIRGRQGEPDIEWRQDGTANAILTPNGGRAGIGVGAIAHAIQAGATRENPDSGPDGVGVQEGIAYTLEARQEVQAVQRAWAVRRLTPTECERLQGFPDNFTAIPHRGKPAADGPRYKALGNSMAVNVMRWIGYRIEMVDKIMKENAT